MRIENDVFRFIYIELFNETRQQKDVRCKGNVTLKMTPQ
jgi:hypothetical protein